MDELDAFGTVMDGGEVDHFGLEGTVLLGLDAGCKGLVEVAHGFQPAFGVAGGETTVGCCAVFDAAVAAMTFHNGAVTGDHGDLLALFLLPQDGAVLTVDADTQVIVKMV